MEHFIQQPPYCGNYVDAVSQMQYDVRALKQHGASFGIDCDPIRVAHAYQHQLEVMFAEGHDAFPPHASCPAHSSHTATMPTTAPSTFAAASHSHSTGLHALLSNFHASTIHADPSAAIHVAAMTSSSQFCSGVPDLQSMQVGAPFAVQTGVNPEGNDSDVGRLAKRHRPR